MKIAVIGCGVMGSALARHCAKQHQVILCDTDKRRSRALAKEIGARVQDQLKEAVIAADVVLLAIKPKDLSAVAHVIGKAFSRDQLLISVLAGVPLDMLKRHLPHVSILRIMPNLALLSGKGVIGMAEDPHLSLKMRKRVDSLLEGLGLNVWMAESQIEALTALTASGIGFVFLMLEAMMEGGICLGFSSEEAKRLVLQTMAGAIALVHQTGKHPAELKLNIASPAGTTIAGLKEMEDRGVRSGIINALLVAYQRGLLMQKELEKKGKGLCRSK